MTVTAALAIANYTANNNIASQVVADTAANLVASLPGLASLLSHTKLTSVTLTDNDPTFQATAAQIGSLASLPNFALATGATLSVRDTAVNLLSPGNATGLAKATGVSVSGTSNTVTAAQSATLAAMPGFAVAAGAKLVISDTATNMLLSSNSAGMAKATSVSLSGVNTVTAAQATKLVGLHTFGLATSATMAVSDTATNILASANATGIARATGVSLTGVNAVTAAQATTLAALTGFGLGSGATLVVSDSASNLLASANAAGLVPATAVSLTGTGNTATAAQATTLAGLHGFALANGASLAVVDSATKLLLASSAAGEAIATSSSVTGANTVTADQATVLAGLAGFTVASGATLLVADSANNLLAAVNAKGLAKATSISLAGTSNITTAAQATTLAGMVGFTRAVGATLVVSDSATNLLASDNAAGVSKATGVLLAGTNTVTAAQATSLAGLAGFGLATGAALVVSDNAGNLLASVNSAGDTAATRVSLIGANTVTAAQAASLAGLAGFTLTPGATLLVSDSAVNLLANGGAAGLANATAVLLTGSSNVVTAAQVAALAGLHGFSPSYSPHSSDSLMGMA